MIALRKGKRHSAFLNAKREENEFVHVLSEAKNEII